MALSASNESAKIHDSHYGPDLLGFQCSSSSPHMWNSSRRGRNGDCVARYDDFSVSAYLHVLRPQVLSLSPAPAFSIQRTVQSRTPNPAVFKRVFSMPARLSEPASSSPSSLTAATSSRNSSGASSPLQ